ncbi:hypothetical protein DSO57_1002279 [Entomophthora muscae]|uniref:Uncharacterized protein n=1 Tax=Entomophthora muscae TaxID=34485 RepID=A0ACC2TJR9_9FUNG|nr:hypothetical protein DSO57_1002279 [Entomophthora muscae]
MDTTQTQPEWKEAAELIPEDETLAQTNQSMETNESPQIPEPTNEPTPHRMDQSESDTTSEEEGHRKAKSVNSDRERGRQTRNQSATITREILLTRGIAEADLERWEEMDLSCAQINRWHKEGFRPAEAAL